MYQRKTSKSKTKNTAAKRKGYWENISKRQCRNEIKNKRTTNHIKAIRERIKCKGE